MLNVLFLKNSIYSWVNGIDNLSELKTRWVMSQGCCGDTGTGIRCGV